MHKAALAGRLPVQVSRWIARCAVQFLHRRVNEDVTVRLSGQPDLFRPVPRSMVEESEWRIAKVCKWKDPTEHIFLKEARASLAALGWLAAQDGVFQTRVLNLGDNEGVVLGYNKARSSVPPVLRLHRQSAGLSFALRWRARWRHLEGFRHPCDGPTRPRLCRAPVRGGVLRVPTATGHCQCPPGLCCCGLVGA